MQQVVEIQTQTPAQFLKALAPEDCPGYPQDVKACYQCPEYLKTYCKKQGGLIYAKEKKEKTEIV